jgi:hypothetical protein
MINLFISASRVRISGSNVNHDFETVQTQSHGDFPPEELYSPLMFPKSIMDLHPGHIN